MSYKIHSIVLKADASTYCPLMFKSGRLHNLPVGSNLDEAIEALDDMCRIIRRELLIRRTQTVDPPDPEQLWLPGLAPETSKPRPTTKAPQQLSLADLGL